MRDRPKPQPGHAAELIDHQQPWGGSAEPLFVADLSLSQGSMTSSPRSQRDAAIDDEDLENNQDQLASLSQRMSRTEPEVPSIDIALAHEAVLQTEYDLQRNDGREHNAAELDAEHDLGWEL